MWLPVLGRCLWILVLVRCLWIPVPALVRCLWIPVLVRWRKVQQSEMIHNPKSVLGSLSVWPYHNENRTPWFMCGCVTDLSCFNIASNYFHSLYNRHWLIVIYTVSTVYHENEPCYIIIYLKFRLFPLAILQKTNLFVPNQ